MESMPIYANTYYSVLRSPYPRWGSEYILDDFRGASPSMQNFPFGEQYSLCRVEEGNERRDFISTPIRSVVSTYTFGQSQPISNTEKSANDNNKGNNEKTERPAPPTINVRPPAISIQKSTDIKPETIPVHPAETKKKVILPALNLNNIKNQ